MFLNHVVSLEFYTINITHSVTAEDFRSVLTGNQIGLIYTCLKNSLYLCTYITKNFQKTLMMYARKNNLISCLFSCCHYITL